MKIISDENEKTRRVAGSCRVLKWKTAPAEFIRRYAGPLCRPPLTQPELKIKTKDRRSREVEWLMRDEPHRIAANIAKLARWR
jgi:hypothetical protein